MSTAALLLCRDEADIIETTVRHLLANVDEVLVSDNLSADGTGEILAELQAEGAPLLVFEDTEPGHYQGNKMTWLAMCALRERGHRWALCCDADEIWLAPDGRPIRDWLDGVGREIQFVKAAIYNHVATADDDPAVADPVARIRWRQRTPHEMRWGKVACRLRPDLIIHDGNHSAATGALGTTGHGLEIRHFPYRSAEQFTAKAIKGKAALEATNLPKNIGLHWRDYGQKIEEDGPEAGHAWFYDAFWSRNPEGDDSLVYDPAPVAVRPAGIGAPDDPLGHPGAVGERGAAIADVLDAAKDDEPLLGGLIQQKTRREAGVDAPDLGEPIGDTRHLSGCDERGGTPFCDPACPHYDGWMER